MSILQHILMHGQIFSSINVVALLAILYVNPLILLQDYPQDIQSNTAPKTRQEKGLHFFLACRFWGLWCSFHIFQSNCGNSCSELLDGDDCGTALSVY
jgi:hypothetical protein